jgi:HlyD family secretion protein
VNRPWPIRTGGRITLLVIVFVAVVVVAIFLLRGWGRGDSALASVSTEPVERRDISVTVEATGTVEPINLVEVKSKASGQIVKMPVEIGSVVQAGDLLVQIDPRDVQNAFDQSQAALVAAQAKAQVAHDQRQRSDELFAQQVITAVEHEAAILDDANAQASLVAARTNLDLAQQRLEDATVRAPIGGTILDKPVSVGQVISSATSSVSGGTTLLQMAALDRIRMRALVTETDIGRVKEGQTASVVVDAYAQRQFRGTVEKIEPQAVVQQSVTMFPVLISISNEGGLLLPGMNGEVTMLVDERNQVLSVPVDGLRNQRSMIPLAEALGLSVDSLRMSSRRGNRGAEADTSRRAAGSPQSAGAAAAGAPDSARARRFARRSGDGPPSAEQIARWRQRRAQMEGASGAEGGASAQAHGASGASGGTAGSGAGGFGGRSEASGGGFGGTSRVQYALLKTASGYAVRRVRLGLTNYDYAEVVSGLQEGDQVVMLSLLEIQEQRDRLVNRVRERAGGGLTTTSSGNRSGGR